MRSRSFSWLAGLIVSGALLLAVLYTPSTLWSGTTPASDTSAAALPQQPQLIALQNERALYDLYDQTRANPGSAEARLVQIFSLIDQARLSEALALTNELLRDHPNFQLAHLIHGDLKKMRFRPAVDLGNVPQQMEQAATERLAALRKETHRRLSALQERPPVGAVPHQLLALSPRSRHVIAVDASRSRLYLFENTVPADTANGAVGPVQLRLVGDFFISVGTTGMDKRLEGDQRTPLGVYYITSLRHGDTLPDLYGPGALTMNYPTPLERRQGRTGHGIWIHGTPSEQFVRAPQASDGCVVVSNPDMEHLMQTVAPVTTPVLVAEQLQWIDPMALEPKRRAFEMHVLSWQRARSQSDTTELQALMAAPPVKIHANQRNRPLNLRNLLVNPQVQLGIWQPSFLLWQGEDQAMVVTFEETVNGQPSGVMRRQYWLHENAQWRIFHDSVLPGGATVQVASR